MFILTDVTTIIPVTTTNTNITTESTPVEALMIETGGNSVGTAWVNSHTGLTDNAGICGTLEDVSSGSKCGVSERGSGRAFFTMKLESPRKILKLQLAFRTDGYQVQGRNVRVQAGHSPEYNASNPVCTEIGQLGGTGLVDYECDQVHEGQYVILSNDQAILTICEAKVFYEAGKLHNHMVINGGK